MTRHADDALAPYDNAVMQSDDALDPDDPPAGQLFIKLRTDRCLTSDRKSYVGVKWRNGRTRSQIIREPSELCCSPLAACSLST